MIRLLLAATILPLSAAPALARAEVAPPGFLGDLPCAPDGVVGNDDVLARLISDTPTVLRGRALTSYVQGRLADDLNAWMTPVSGLALPAAGLEGRTRNLVSPPNGRDPRFVILNGVAPEAAVSLLLNRTAEGKVQFRCRALDVPASPPPPERPTLIVTSVSDAGQTADLKDRPFATFSWLDDRQGDSESASIDLFMGFSGPIWFDSVSPSLAYQRTTGVEPVNDLALALEGGGDVLSWTAGYETDDAFESALYRATLTYLPFTGPNPCAKAWSSPPEKGGRCDLWILADYVDVGDTGEKTDLIDRREFGRLGVRLSANRWIRLGEGEDFLQLSGSYTLYETVSGDDADADLARVTLDYIPSSESPFSFGLTYERGEDLTSFTPIDQIKITLGYRR